MTVVHVCVLGVAVALLALPPGRVPPEREPLWIELPPPVEAVPLVPRRAPTLAALASQAGQPRASAAERPVPSPGVASLASEPGASTAVARPVSPALPEPPGAESAARPAAPLGGAVHLASAHTGGSPPALASPADAAIPSAAAASGPAPAPAAASGSPAVASRASTTGPGMPPAEPARGIDGQPLPDSALGYLRRPEPVYPPASRRLGEAGLVRLHVLIDVEGRPQQVAVVDSSGFPRLDEAASRAVRRALFRPYRRDGEVRPAWVSLSVRFSLEDA